MYINKNMHPLITDVSKHLKTLERRCPDEHRQITVKKNKNIVEKC